MPNICREFSKTGTCKYGNRCHFSHQMGNNNMNNSFTGSDNVDFCRYYQKRSCTNNSCKYLFLKLKNEFKRLNSQSTTGNPVIKAMVYDRSKATVYYGGKGGKIFLWNGTSLPQSIDWNTTIDSLFLLNDVLYCGVTSPIEGSFFRIMNTTNGNTTDFKNPLSSTTPLIYPTSPITNIQTCSIAGNPVLVTSSDDRTIRVWSLELNPLITYVLPTICSCMCFLGEILLCGGADGNLYAVQLSAVPTPPTLVGNLHDDRISSIVSVVENNEPYFLSAGRDGKVELIQISPFQHKTIIDINPKSSFRISVKNDKVIPIDSLLAVLTGQGKYTLIISSGKELKYFYVDNIANEPILAGLENLAPDESSYSIIGTNIPNAGKGELFFIGTSKGNVIGSYIDM